MDPVEYLWPSAQDNVAEFAAIVEAIGADPEAAALGAAAEQDVQVPPQDIVGSEALDDFPPAEEEQGALPRAVSAPAEGTRPRRGTRAGRQRQQDTKWWRTAFEAIQALCFPSLSSVRSGSRILRGI